MKKFILPLAAFLSTAAMASAQVTPQKASTDRSVAKVSSPASKKTAITAVSSSTSAPVKKANTGVAIKRKHHHKKRKSVKPISK